MSNALAAGMSQINVRLPTDLLRQVWQASATADLKTSQWVRQAIREKLERDR